MLEALGGNAAPDRINYLEQKLRLVQTIGAGRDRIRFGLDPLAEYLAGLHVVGNYCNDENKWREFLAHADAAPGAPETIKGFLLAVRDCCLAKGAQLKVANFVADELATRTHLDPAAVARARLHHRVKDLIWRLDLPFAADRRSAAEGLGEIAHVGRREDVSAATPSLIERLGDEDVGVRYAALVALRDITPNDPAVVPALIRSLNDGTPGAIGLLAALSAELARRAGIYVRRRSPRCVGKVE